MTTERTPRDRIADLEEEVRQLRALLAPKARCPNEWLLSPMEKIAYRAIVAGKGGFVASERVVRAMAVARGGEIEYEEVNMRQIVMRLRRKLRKFGMDIEGWRTYGYRLVGKAER